jgi:hypothetical protein
MINWFQNGGVVILFISRSLFLLISASLQGAATVGDRYCVRHLFRLRFQTALVMLSTITVAYRLQNMNYVISSNSDMKKRNAYLGFVSLFYVKFVIVTYLR